MVADHLGCVIPPHFTDIDPDLGVDEANALEWVRPDHAGRVIVTTNPPFRLLDELVERWWSQLLPGDELVLLTTTVAHANNSRPVLFQRLGFMPYADIWSVRWRSPMEDKDGKSLGGAAVDYQIVRAVKGLIVRSGETRQWDIMLPEQWAKVVNDAVPQSI